VRKRFSVEQIVAVVKQAEAGVPVVEVCRRVGITEQTFETQLRHQLFQLAVLLLELLQLPDLIDLQAHKLLFPPVGAAPP
jgi:hypothetical protein